MHAELFYRTGKSYYTKSWKSKEASVVKLKADTQKVRELESSKKILSQLRENQKKVAELEERFPDESDLRAFFREAKEQKAGEIEQAKEAQRVHKEESELQAKENSEHLERLILELENSELENSERNANNIDFVFC